MKKGSWKLIQFCVIFTVIGIIGGWVAARQGDRLDHETDAGEAAQDARTLAGADEEELELPPETLENLGVRVASVQSTSFTQYRSVPATIARTPFNVRPVVAPIGGRVREVFVEPGLVVQAGETLLTLVREPIARPKLALTEELLKPAGEAIHTAVVDLRRALEETGIVQTELARIEKFTRREGDDELPVLPRQKEIDLRYQQVRAEAALERARHELIKHGLTEAQITQVEGGGGIPALGPDTWKRALERNGLWTESAQAIYDIVPASLRQDRWTIATIGELATAGLIDKALIAWLSDQPDGCGHILEIGSLLQQGYSVIDVRSMHDLGALDPLVEVRAPSDGEVADWDVAAIAIAPDARVTSGTQLVSLVNPRDMYLRTQPVGAEVESVLEALGEGLRCEAHPLVEGSGPILRDLEVAFASSDAGGTGTVAWAAVKNEVLSARELSPKRRLRTWKVREGLQYRLRIPTDTRDGVLVLPAESLAEDGPNQIVFVVHGTHFHAEPVVTSYRDEEVVVLPLDRNDHVKVGDAVVISGAYALSFALKGGDQPDAHAGHSH